MLVNLVTNLLRGWLGFQNINFLDVLFYRVDQAFENIFRCAIRR